MAYSALPVRAEILDTGDERVLSAQIEIGAPPALIFDILIQPRRHKEIDGSRSVQGVIEGPERLYQGAAFKVRMKIRVNYWVTNTVLDFEPDRRITWSHLLGNRWTYQLTPLPSGGARSCGRRTTFGPQDGKHGSRPSLGIWDRGSGQLPSPLFG